MKLLFIILISLVIYNLLKAVQFFKGFTGLHQKKGDNRNQEVSYHDLDIRDAEFKDVDE